jgi:A/G-specific adenine glycosylase
VGAIRSIAFGASVPLVDGNVARVLSRLFVVEERGAAAQRRLWALAAELVPTSDASSWNQGLMELGATLCTPKQPRCAECPLASHCQAARAGNPERLPMRPKKRPVPERVVETVALWRRGRWLMARRPPAGLWGGLWELPRRDSLPPVETRQVGEVVHVLTHLKVRFRLARGPAPPGKLAPSGYDAQRWVTRAALEAGQVPLSTAARRVLALLWALS